MLDQILGRPSPTLRRSQIFLVIFFWLWRLYKGDGRLRGARGDLSFRRKDRPWLEKVWVQLVGRRVVTFTERVNDRLRHFTPYQLVLGTLTITYALRNVGDLFGLAIPEPLGSLYTRSYYRATYVNTAFDAGFASAMTIRPKWLKDITSMLFGVYYLIWASEGDEVLRRFRALCTVEMLRVTWEKTNNPYIRLVTAFHRPSVPIVRHVTIPRPSTSSRANLPPVKAMLFFNGTEAQLAKATRIVVDFPGGGFIAMGPECHEERLRRWAKRTGKPVLGVDYGKAPEYPYPWAIEEGFDAYRTLMETKGSIIGIKSGRLGAVLTGDSAGGNICATIMLRILEHPTGIPRPVSMIFAYPALDFNFTSWMSPSNLQVLRTEQSETHIPGIAHGKDHMRHKSPLSLVNDVPGPRKRERSWGQALGAKLPSLSPMSEKVPGNGPTSPVNTWGRSLPRNMSTKIAGWLAPPGAPDVASPTIIQDTTSSEPESSDDDDGSQTVRDYRSDAEKSLHERVKTPQEERRMELAPLDVKMKTRDEVAPLPGVEMDEKAQVQKKRKKAPIGTRLTMTSRVGYFQDRIISPSMMRAMAILYIGPKRNPDFETDYYISPLLSPPHLLAHFPPVYLICGERDPFVDDTIIFAGKIREAKRARKAKAAIAAQHKSARYGEGLRMSTSSSKTEDVADHILRETDDDWVQMRIIEGWGHGFMQMTSLMREVDSVLVEMADWIDESFEKYSVHDRDMREVAAAKTVAQFMSARLGDEPLSSPDEHIPPPTTTHVKPVRSYRRTKSGRVVGGPDLGDGTLRPSTSTSVDSVAGDNIVAPGGMSDEDPSRGQITINFVPRHKRRKPPTTQFNPVPRRPSKEKLNLYRVSSAPKFDLDETGSSGEAMVVRTPPLGSKTLPLDAPKGSGAFAFFNPNRSTSSSGSTPKAIGTPAPTLFGPRRSSNGSASGSKPTNSLVAAAVAGARAASPALAAAGLVPQQVENVSEAEVMRRRRLEAVFGMGETDSADVSEEEDEEEEGFKRGDIHV